MTQKWNLQDIRPAQPQKHRVAEGKKLESIHTKVVDMDQDDAEETLSINIVDGNKKKNRSLFFVVLIFIAIVGAGLLASALMGGAEVTVYPKHKEPNVNALFEAKISAQEGELPYEVMTLEAEGERQVKAAGEEVVTTQAIGTIFIYNTQQKDPVRLVTNTRFESPDGLIFKIKDSVVIPGYRDVEGKKAPGVATAQVFADQPGPAYNIAPVKFRIPGFKGDPEYENVYGESTEMFTGGFNDKKFIIEDSELQTAQQTLRTELRDSLLGRIDAEKPAGFVLFKDAVTFTYQSLPSVAYGDNLATIKEKVLLRIPVFKEDNFAEYIAKAAVPGFENEPVRIVDYAVFTFGYKSATTSSSDISNYTNIEFNLTGKPQIVWKYDTDKLRADLMNVNKTALIGVLGAYPSIEKATAVVRPFWKSKFPVKLTDIKIIEIVGVPVQN